MNNETTIQRIKRESDWFLINGTAGFVDDYPEKIKELVGLIPKIASILSESQPEQLEKNLKNSLSLNKAVELGMILSGIGGTPLQLLNLYFREKIGKSVVLNASFKQNDIQIRIRRTLTSFGTEDFLVT